MLWEEPVSPIHNFQGWAASLLVPARREENHEHGGTRGVRAASGLHVLMQGESSHSPVIPMNLTGFFDLGRQDPSLTPNDKTSPYPLQALERPQCGREPPLVGGGTYLGMPGIDNAQCSFHGHSLLTWLLLLGLNTPDIPATP